MAEPGAAAPLLETTGLTRHFRIGGLRGRVLHAVDSIGSLQGDDREIVALIGESETRAAPSPGCWRCCTSLRVAQFGFAVRRSLT